MRILSFKRDFLNQLIDDGAMKKKDLKHFDICTEIKNKTIQEDIAEKFKISSRQIRNIKQCKCPEIGLSKGRPYAKK